MARYFTGSASSSVAFGPSFTANFPFSIAAWINLVPGAVCLVGGNANGCVEVQAAVNSLNLNAQSSVAIASVKQGRYINASSWCHVIVTYQNSGTAAFYVNGLPSGTSSSGTAIATAANYKIGVASNGETFIGAISDFIFTKFVMTPAEAWLLGTGRIRPFTLRAGAANYIAYLPLNGSLGSASEQDYSGNGNNGTVSQARLVPGPPQLNPTIIVVRGATVAAKRRFPNQPLPW